jgi:hypothetical protein
MMEKRQANTGFPETAARDEAVRQAPRATARLPLSIGQTYERFLGLPPALVLAVLWFDRAVAVLERVGAGAVGGGVPLGRPGLLLGFHSPECVEG